MNNNSSTLSIVLISLLCISIILNIINYGQIQSLKNELNILQNNDLRIEQSLNHSVAAIKNTVASMQEQQSWITPVSLDRGDDLSDFRTIKLSWGIREYPEGAAVTLYYRLGNGDFTALAAKSTGGGSFIAELQVPKTYDPDWHVTYQVDQSAESAQRVERAIEEKNSINTDVLDYYISMQNGQQIMTSDKKSINMGKIAQAAAPINVSVYEKGIKYKITMLEDSLEESEVTIDYADLTVYDNGKKITTVPFKTLENFPSEEEIWHSALEAIWTTDIEDKIYPEFEIKIVYTNGKEIVKNLY